MPWWGWLGVGGAFLGAELLLATESHLAVFGAAAVLVGFFGLLGLEGPIWAQWMLFVSLGLGLIVGLRTARWGGPWRHLRTGLDASLSGAAIVGDRLRGVGVRGRRALLGGASFLASARPPTLAWPAMLRRAPAARGAAAVRTQHLEEVEMDGFDDLSVEEEQPWKL